MAVPAQRLSAVQRPNAIPALLAELRRLTGGSLPPDRLASMLEARRRIATQPVSHPLPIQHPAVARKIGPAGELGPDDLVSSPLEGDLRVPEMHSRLSGLLHLHKLANQVVGVMAGNPGVQGMFVPTRNSEQMVGLASWRAGGDHARGSRRHEIMHGYNEAARRGAKNLPIASRLVGLLGDPYVPSWRTGLGAVLDEAVATSAGGRSPFTVPWKHYAGLYSQGEKPWRQAAAIARGLGAAQDVASLPYTHPVLTGMGVVAGGGLGYALGPGSKKVQEERK